MEPMSLLGSTLPDNHELVRECWHGDITREDCLNILMNKGPDQSYLLRAKPQGDLALSFKMNNQVKHVLCKNNGGYYSVAKKDFPSVAAIIDYYRKNAISSAKCILYPIAPIIPESPQLQSMSTGGSMRGSVRSASGIPSNRASLTSVSSIRGTAPPPLPHGGISSSSEPHRTFSSGGDMGGRPKSVVSSSIAKCNTTGGRSSVTSSSFEGGFDSERNSMNSRRPLKNSSSVFSNKVRRTSGATDVQRTTSITSMKAPKLPPGHQPNLPPPRYSPNTPAAAQEYWDADNTGASAMDCSADDAGDDYLTPAAFTTTTGTGINSSNSNRSSITSQKSVNSASSFSGSNRSSLRGKEEEDTLYDNDEYTMPKREDGRSLPPTMPTPRRPMPDVNMARGPIPAVPSPLAGGLNKKTDEEIKLENEYFAAAEVGQETVDNDARMGEQNGGGDDLYFSGTPILPDDYSGGGAREAEENAYFDGIPTIPEGITSSYLQSVGNEEDLYFSGTPIAPPSQGVENDDNDDLYFSGTPIAPEGINETSQNTINANTNEVNDISMKLSQSTMDEPAASPKKPTDTTADTKKAPTKLSRADLLRQEFKKMLRTPEKRNEFTDFLVGEYSVENILFCDAIDEYMQQSTFMDKDQLYQIALDTHAQYLTPTSPHEVNIPAQCLAEINETLFGDPEGTKGQSDGVMVNEFDVPAPPVNNSPKKSSKWKMKLKGKESKTKSSSNTEVGTSAAAKRANAITEEELENVFGHSYNHIMDILVTDCYPRFQKLKK